MMLLFALVPLLAFLAMAQNTSVPVFPSNSSSYMPNSNATHQLVLGLPITPAGANDPPLFALTDVASNLPPRDAGTLQGVGDHLWNTNPQTSTNISIPDRAIAYIQCDMSAYNGNIGLSKVIDNAIAANVSSIVFYSTNENFCLLNNTLSQSQSAFGRYFTMTNTVDSIRVANSINGMMAGNTGAAEVMTQAAYNNVMNAGQNSSGIDNTPSTAVAMIILYSITGVITALFLVIIVTGAVRAHRHPERYGPQNVLGRARQSRAKGIARAMLDTIPIVKFGEKQPAKPADVEMNGESSAAPETRAASGTSDTNEKTAENTAQSNGAQGDAAADGAASATGATGTDNAAGNAEGKEADNVTCSICTEDFEQGQDIRVLPCDHKFHPACVDPWLLDVSGTCPLCRVDLRPKEEQTGGEGNADQRDGQPRGSREGEPLPPPLNQGRNRRRDTVLNFLDRRRMQDSNPEERISALRRYRQAMRRSRAPPADNAGESSGQEASTTQEQR